MRARTCKLGAWGMHYIRALTSGAVQYYIRALTSGAVQYYVRAPFTSGAM